MITRPVSVIAVVAALSLTGRVIIAQDTVRVQPPAPGPDSVRGPRCDGETITGITIVRQEPVMVERSAGWARPFLRFALAGEPTRESAIAPFLMVRDGDPCTEMGLAETERVLRAQPYLADVRARAVSDGAGGVRVEIMAVDDIRSIIGLGFRDGEPTKLKLGSGNVAGYGLRAFAQWQQGFAFRDGWGAVFTHYHVFGRPFLFEGVLERQPLGDIATASLSRPLYSQLQNLAWSASVARVDRYQPFVRTDDEPTLSLDVGRRSWATNALYRIGGGSLGLFAGVLLAGDRVAPAGRAVIITDTGFVSDPDTVLADRYGPARRTLYGPILGARALSFFKAEAFDALEGAQDVARGIQFGALVARATGSGLRGAFVASEVYAGGGTPRSFLGLQAAVESGRAEGEWRDVLAGGRLAWYARPTRRRTRVASFEYAGVWRSAVPIQLTLGADRVGVRGYEGSATAGARRAVLRLEERIIFPGIARYLGFGGAGFVDVGKMWAGDVPFGDTVNPRVGAGLGLIFAVPRTSRRNLRIDVAAPLVSDDGAHWGVNVTITGGRPRFWRQPGDLARARSAAQTPVVFGWP